MPLRSNFTKKRLIITRDQWGARDPLWVSFLQVPVDYVFFEYTSTAECKDVEQCKNSVRFIQEFNMQLRNNPDIRYNFLISPGGAVFEGRGWDVSPRLPQKWGSLRRRAIFIGMMGLYLDHPPSEEMFLSRLELVKYGIIQECIKEKHLEFSITTPRKREKSIL